jgi:nucleotide-binding universal stress UspA family protein
MTVPDATGMLAPMPSPRQVEAVDRIESEHAAAVAEAGAALARSLGATAEAHAERDRLDPAETLTALAERLDAAAIAVGSRGLGATKARLLGSVSRRLMQDARRPVLVVHGDARPAS